MARFEIPEKFKEKAFKVTRKTMREKIGLDLTNKTLIDFEGADLCIKFQAKDLRSDEFDKLVGFLKYHQFSFEGRGNYGRSVWCRDAGTLRRRKKK